MSATSAIGRILTAWPQTTAWPDATIEAYGRYLGDQDDAVLDEAVDSLIRTEPWPPSIATVLGACAAVRIEHRRRQSGRRELSPCRNHCDHGWEWAPDGVAPCAQCQPDLARRVDRGEFRPTVDRARGDGIGPPAELTELRAVLAAMPQRHRIAAQAQPSDANGQRRLPPQPTDTTEPETATQQERP